MASIKHKVVPYIPPRLKDPIIVNKDMNGWSVDNEGRRYRMNGSIIEYAPDIITTRGNFTDTTFSELSAAYKDARETRAQNETENPGSENL